MLIVNGAYRGEEAELLELDQEKFSCSVKIKVVSIHFLVRAYKNLVSGNIPKKEKGSYEQCKYVFILHY